MRQFVHENFDKLLLALLYLIVLSTVLHLAHWRADQQGHHPVHPECPERVLPLAGVAARL